MRPSARRTIEAQMNWIKHVVFVSILAAVHYGWREVVQAFAVITRPTVTWADAYSSPMLSHEER